MEMEDMAQEEIKLSDKLAVERTVMAAGRTLMAWIRTALSLITFGFTIYKFLQYLQQDLGVIRRPQGPRNLGLTLIGIGTFSLILACMNHWKYIRRLNPDQPYRPWELTFIVACLIALVGLLAFGSIILRFGPFE
jgi:putative membrane protein